VNERGTAVNSSYQWWLTALLSTNFGFVLFDRNALNFLMPFVQPELGLNNTEIGALAGCLSFTWALAAFGVGYVADRFGSRKRLLVLSSVAFALCSFASGLAPSFAVMMGTRLAMGVAEGGIMPLSQLLIAQQIDERHRGVAMGVAQGLGSSLMGSFVAPVLLVSFATAYGWRHAFFLAAAPALVVALVIAVVVRDTPAQSASQPEKETVQERGTLWQALVDSNVVRCVALSILFVSYLVVTWAFMPLYLTRSLGYDPSTMSWLMGVLGIAATLYSFALTALSDRIGRRPVVAVTSLLAFIVPLGALFHSGAPWTLGAVFFIGWSFTGAMPLVMAAIPSESVDARNIGSALGICMGGSEILGGVLSPLLAGSLADHIGLQAPLYCLLAFALLSCLVAVGLRETAPRVLARGATFQQRVERQ
jgi:MFS transporter, ACS family, hexuronate transporter